MKISKGAARRVDAALLERARAIVARYRLVVEPSPGLGYIGHSIELRGVSADGRSPEECVRNSLEAQAGMVAAMLEAGEQPPAPSVGGQRAAQINIRVTEDEKMVLEAAAQRQGFRNISEFLRTTALGAANAA